MILTKYIDYLSQKGIKTAHQVNREHVSNFMFDLKKHDMSATTICRNLAAVKMFHRFLVRENLAKEDPTTLVDTPKLWKRIPSVLTQAEIESMIAAASGKKIQQVRDQAILEIFYASGLRVSELSDLKTTSINYEVGFVRAVGKGSKERIIPLGKKAREALQKYLLKARPQLLKNQTNDVLFLSRLGKKISRQSLWAVIKFYAQKGEYQENDQAAYPAPYLCDPFIGTWRGFAFCPGNAGACGYFHHPDLYACGQRTFKERA